MKLPSPGPGAVVAVLVCAWLCGCGPKEEKLYRVSGSVTFNGKPIPKGNIYFDPRGDGPQGFATIVDGKYDTAEQGKGVRGGSTYDVRVGGFTGIVANEAPFGQPLFPEFNGVKEFPTADTTFDLEIPKAR